MVAWAPVSVGSSRALIRLGGENWGRSEAVRMRTSGLVSVQTGAQRARLWIRIRCACRPSHLFRGGSSGLDLMSSSPRGTSGADYRPLIRRSGPAGEVWRNLSQPADETTFGALIYHEPPIDCSFVYGPAVVGLSAQSGPLFTRRNFRKSAC